MHARSLAELRRRPGGAQGVHHHGAAAGTELDQRDRVGRSYRLPHIGGPQADQFAEHLTDLRRRDEIAGPAEWSAAVVVAVLRIVEAYLHKLGNRDWSYPCDAPANFHVERGAIFRHHEWAGWRRSAKVMSNTPAMNSGRQSSMPMVMPPHRKPSCGSGSRKNSQNDRRIA